MAEDEWKVLLHQTSQTQQKYASAHHKSLDHAAKLVQEMEIVLSVSSTELVALAAKKHSYPSLRSAVLYIKTTDVTIY